MSALARTTALAKRVPYVVGVRAQEQVRRVYAGRRIALVAHAHARRYWSVVQLVGNAVGRLPIVRRAAHAIPGHQLAAPPQPAAGRLAHVAPERLFQGHGSVLVAASLRAVATSCLGLPRLHLESLSASATEARCATLRLGDGPQRTTSTRAERTRRPGHLTAPSQQSCATMEAGDFAARPVARLRAERLARQRWHHHFRLAAFPACAPYPSATRDRVGRHRLSFLGARAPGRYNVAGALCKYSGGC